MKGQETQQQQHCQLVYIKILIKTMAEPLGIPCTFLISAKTEDLE